MLFFSYDFLHTLEITLFLYMTGYQVPPPSFCNLKTAIVTLNSETIETCTSVVRNSEMKLY